MQGLAFLIPLVGVLAACVALSVSRASYYRAQKPKPAPKPRPRPRRALSDEERARVLATLDSESFMDLAPAQVYAKLLEDGEYLCSTRTMYRVLAAAGQVRERRAQRRHPAYVKPQLVATAPNQVWSWDTTKLPGPTKGTYYTLYVILDIFSRYIVGWQVTERESATAAQELIAACCRDQRIVREQLTASPPDGEHVARVMNQLAAPSGPLRDTAGATLITLFTAETWSEMADRQRQLFRLLRGEDRGHYPHVAIVPCTCNADVLELAAYWTEQLARIGQDPLDTEARLVRARWPEVVDRVVEFAKHGHPRATYAHNTEFWTALAVLVEGDAGSERPAPWAFDGPPSEPHVARNAAPDDTSGGAPTTTPSNLSDLLSRVLDRITVAGKRAVSEALLKPMLYAGGAIAGGLLLYLLMRSQHRCEGRS